MSVELEFKLDRMQQMLDTILHELRRLQASRDSGKINQDEMSLLRLDILDAIDKLFTSSAGAPIRVYWLARKFRRRLESLSVTIEDVVTPETLSPKYAVFRHPSGALLIAGTGAIGMLPEVIRKMWCEVRTQDHAREAFRILEAQRNFESTYLTLSGVGGNSTFGNSNATEKPSERP